MTLPVRKSYACAYMETTSFALNMVILYTVLRLVRECHIFHTNPLGAELGYVGI